MAFTTINSSELEVGLPIKKSLFDKIKGNFDDHETRIDTLEQGAGIVSVCDFEVVGFISNYTESELANIATHRAPCDYTLSELVVTILNSSNGYTSAGVQAVTSSSGYLEIGMRKSTDGGATFSNILTTNPKIPDGKYTTGTSSNTAGCIPVVFADTVVHQDDIITISIIKKKDTQGTLAITCYGVL
jgi:hypothetical protein